MPVLQHNDPRAPTDWRCSWTMPPSESFFKVPTDVHHLEGNRYEYQVGFVPPAGTRQVCQVRVDDFDGWSGFSNALTVPEPGGAGLVAGALILAALTRRRGKRCDWR